MAALYEEVFKLKRSQSKDEMDKRQEARRGQRYDRPDCLSFKCELSSQLGVHANIHTASLLCILPPSLNDVLIFKRSTCVAGERTTPSHLDQDGSCAMASFVGPHSRPTRC
ncbi:unnamed protein product [Boreogadus saida]